MADYYPLIARAIAGLDPSAPGESRRALYERARSALIAQLRSGEPPLSESEITRERLALEEAVRKVEFEAAQRARHPSRSGGDAARSGGRAGDAFRANSRPASRPGEPAASSSTAGSSGLSPSSSLAPPRARPAAPPPPRNDRPSPGSDEPRAPRPDPAAPARPGAQATRSARKTYANVPSPSPEFDRLEPNMDRGADPDAP